MRSPGIPAHHWVRAALVAALATAAVVAVFLATSPAQAGGATCDGVRATIVGTDGGNEIDGTAGRDVIQARAGNDEVDGHGGRDLICGGPGADSLAGDARSDRVLGGLGNDELDGNRGADRLVGGPGFDDIDGGAGNDVCRSGEHVERC